MSLFESLSNENQFILRQCKPKKSPVNCLTFTSDNLWVAVGRLNGQVEIYDNLNHVLYMTLPGGEVSSSSDVFLLERKGYSRHTICSASIFNYRLILTELNGSIIEWNLRTQEKEKYDILSGCTLATCLNDNYLFISSDSNRIHCVQLHKDGFDTIQLLFFFSDLTGRAFTMTIALNDTLICGTSEGRVFFVESLERHKEGLNVEPFDKTGILINSLCIISALLYVPEKNHLVIGDSNGRISFWDIDLKEEIRSFQHHKKDIISLILFEKSIIAFDRAGEMSSYKYIHDDVNTVNCQFFSPMYLHFRRKIYPKLDVECVTMSDDTKCLALGMADGSAKILTNITQTFVDRLTSTYCDLDPTLNRISTLSRNPPSIVYREDYSLVITEIILESQAVHLRKFAILHQDMNNKEEIRSFAIQGDYVALSSNGGTTILCIDPKSARLKCLPLTFLENTICTALSFCIFSDILVTAYSYMQQPMIGIVHLKAAEVLTWIHCQHAVVQIIAASDAEFCVCRSITNYFWVLNLATSRMDAIPVPFSFAKAWEPQYTCISSNGLFIFIVTAVSKEMFLYYTKFKKQIKIFHYDGESYDEQFQVPKVETNFTPIVGVLFENADQSTLKLYIYTATLIIMLELRIQDGDDKDKCQCHMLNVFEIASTESDFLKIVHFARLNDQTATGGNFIFAHETN